MRWRDVAYLAAIYWEVRSGPFGYRTTTQVAQAYSMSYSGLIKAMTGPTPREAFLNSIAHLSPEDIELLTREYDRATET